VVVTKYYCDRCGKEVYNNLYDIWYTSKRCCFQHIDKKEVCRECYNEIIDFMKRKNKD